MLGPLEVSDGGVRLTPSRLKERTLLALLLANAGRTVSTAEVNRALWGASPPPSARSNLYSYVAELRRTLNRSRATDGERLTRSPGGYLLRVEDGELDAKEFELLVRGARQALRDGRPDAAVQGFVEAQRLWRGSPLMDITSASDELRREAARLEELRLVVVEDLAEANMAVGNDEEVAATLPRLVEEHPLREKLWSLLMLAWYRTGRQGEALAAYHRVYRLLNDELGVEPGQKLKQVHQHILGAVGGPDPRPAADAFPPPTPRQLPMDASAFVGRENELADLCRPGADRQADPAITVLTGFAGVGKTALALRWARGLCRDFPDGQLYVDLGEHAEDGPVSVVEAQRRLLAPFGVPAAQVPSDPHSSAALYRSVLAGRRLLIVLDNAISIDQVRPLLPGTPSCTTIVTSRDAMTGLVAGEGARRMTVRPLPPRTAVDVLGGIIGAERVILEEAAATQLALLCGRVPLALRIAAAQLADDPLRGIADYVAELLRVGVFDRLFVEGDRTLDMGTSIGRTYDRLSPRARLVFHLLADTEPLTVADVAHRLATPADATRSAMSELVAVHLAHRDDDSRFTVSDLLRRYAEAREAAPHVLAHAAC
jgi:DNA-binding SARP family transcriptional activator